MDEYQHQHHHKQQQQQHRQQHHHQHQQHQQQQQQQQHHSQHHNQPRQHHYHQDTNPQARLDTMAAPPLPLPASTPAPSSRYAPNNAPITGTYSHHNQHNHHNQHHHAAGYSHQSTTATATHRPPASSAYDWNNYPSQEHHHHAYANPPLAAQPLQQQASVVVQSKSAPQPLRTKISERLQQIDREAFESEERQYQVKAEEIQNELSQILRGTYPAFLEGLGRLAAERDRTLAAAEQSHRYLVDLYERAYKQERDAAERVYATEKQSIYDKVAADIDERRRRLREEKDTLDISFDFVFEAGSRTSSKRNLRKRGIDQMLGGFGDGLVMSSSSNSAGAGAGAGGAAGGVGGGRAQNKRKNNQAFSMQGIGEDDIVTDLVALRRVTGVIGPLSININGKKNNKNSKR